MLDAIQDFLVDAHDCNADLLLVATSRPQGYNDDFDPRYYRHRNLLPLDVPQALHYADRLTAQRWGVDDDKCRRILERIERAGKEEATAYLMRSPLQVTIMTLLVETIGQPPHERWRLFNDYYQVIFRREKERAIPAADLLNAHQRDIDAIHERVGLTLQRRSEQAGGTEALLTEAGLADIVNERLAAEGYEGEERTKLCDAIIRAAMDRLVFLVAPQQGKIGFEIRSLQEFMAAQYLMDGSDETVSTRLRAIAPAAYWRNCFLFAAGRCFQDRQHLRDSIHTLCCELNEDDIPANRGRLEQAILAGSRLALDILEDGAVARQPAQLRLYARLALRLLELPPCTEQIRLARQYRPELEGVFTEELGRHLADVQPARQLGAWRVLLQLSVQDIEWVQRIADSHWPSEPDTVLEIVEAGDGIRLPAWVLEHWSQAVFDSRPSKVTASARVVAGSLHGRPDVKKVINAYWWVGSITSYSSITSFVKFLIEGLGDNIEWGFPSLFPHTSVPDVPIPDGAGIEWRWFGLVLEFLRKPSPHLLADILEEIPETDTSRLDRIPSGRFPWLISECLLAIEAGFSKPQLIDAIRRGDLGDPSDWQSFEERLASRPVSRDDILRWSRDGLPFNQSGIEIGVPMRLSSWSTNTGSISSTISILYSLRGAAENTRLRGQLASGILSLLHTLGAQGKTWKDVGVATLSDLACDHSDWWCSPGVIAALPEAIWRDPRGIDLIEKLGRGRIDRWGYSETLKPLGNRLESQLQWNNQKIGLLRILAKLCADGYRPSDPALNIEPDLFAEPRDKIATLLVRLAQGRLTDSETFTLIRLLIGLASSETEIINDALAILEQEDTPDATAAHALPALFTGLPDADWRTRRKVLGHMQERQRRRLSDLADLI